MSNYSAELVSTEVVGKSGSGKTTLIFKTLLNTPAAVRFVFDDRGQAAARLNKKHCGTANECEGALPSRWVCFNPSRMFPGCAPGTETGENAFRWFCHWAYQVARRGRGRKIFLVDEVWKWCNTRKLPIEFATIIQEGRVEELELVTATQLPEKMPFAINGQATEVVAFKLDHEEAVEALREMRLPGFVAKEIWDLPLGSFISFDRNKGTKFAGKIF